LFQFECIKYSFKYTVTDKSNVVEVYLNFFSLRILPHHSWDWMDSRGDHNRTNRKVQLYLWGCKQRLRKAV